MRPRCATIRIKRSCPQRSEGTAASANNSNNWWERSPNSSNANNFANVNGNNGNANNNNNANNLLAVRPDSPVDTISHITPRVAVRQGHPAATDGESASMGEGDMVVSGAVRVRATTANNRRRFADMPAYSALLCNAGGGVCAGYLPCGRSADARCAPVRSSPFARARGRGRLCPNGSPLQAPVRPGSFQACGKRCRPSRAYRTRGGRFSPEKPVKWVSIPEKKGRAGT